ncbi:SPOR domain-containing protein [Treponema pectinovorum]|uniref:SPOR domain-containing protein n=1 Tax=Treponema pectinovorum TaxID=164 RepID=UPI0011F0E555|nr:SPOR domain-containing protein [Treponema pectinovorum]
MEQKRILWIVAAAGVFLLVVMGGALILSSQKSKSEQNLYDISESWVNAPKTADVSPIEILPSTNAQTQPSEQVNSEDKGNNQNNSSPLKVENVTVISDNTLVYGTGSTTTIDLNSLKSNPPQDSTLLPKNDYTANRMNEVEENQISNKAQTNQKTSPDSYYAPQPKTQEQQKVVKSAQKSTSTAKKNENKKITKAEKTVQTQKVETFWIQVGSYEAKKSADEARSILDKIKIQNEVFTYKDSKGKLFFRVRAGPYTTKSEAEYWQKRILATDEFAKTKSYVVKN